MKKFTLILVLLAVWSWPMAFATGTEPQDSNAGKSHCCCFQEHGGTKKVRQRSNGRKARGNKKTNSKDKEDCGCETTLFGEPVPQGSETDSRENKQ